MHKRNQNTSLPEIKFFITTLSITAIIAFWNLFAKQAVESKAQDNSNPDTLDHQASEDSTHKILPTLVPLVLNQTGPLENNANDTQLSISDLQEVEAPSPVVSEGNSPIVVDSINLAQPTQPQTQEQANSSAAEVQPTVAATTSSSK